MTSPESISTSGRQECPLGRDISKQTRDGKRGSISDGAVLFTEMAARVTELWKYPKCLGRTKAFCFLVRAPVSVEI